MTMPSWYGRKLILGKLDSVSKLSTEAVDNSVCIFKNDGKWAL